MFLQYFDTVGWFFWPVKTVARITYTVGGDVISRPTQKLLSFALCLEWINGIYNTPDTGKIDRKHINIVETWQKYGHDICREIVIKRPRNLLNEIQNVFINGKQVKIDKITQIIPWFPRFYAKTTTGNSQRYYTYMRQQCPLHGDNDYTDGFQAAANSLAA